MKHISDITILAGLTLLMTLIIHVTKAVTSYEDAIIGSIGFIEALIIFNFAKRPPNED